VTVCCEPGVHSTRRNSAGSGFAHWVISLLSVGVQRTDLGPRFFLLTEVKGEVQWLGGNVLQRKEDVDSREGM
jgi:hypothetical protein